MTEKYPFLSPQWEQKAQEISQTTTIDVPSEIIFTMNITITPTPYGDKYIGIKALDGSMELADSLYDEMDLTIITDYDTAYSLFLKGDIAVILSAMLEGKVTVNGDIAKLLSMATITGPIPSMPFLENLSAQLREITE